LSFVTSPISEPTPSVVSLAWTPFSTVLTPSVPFSLLMIGTMFWAAKLDLGSSRMTKSLLSIAGSVVNRSAASIWPRLRAFTVTGPPTSVTVYLPNSTP
jgi:hypothetical protein